MTFIIVLPPPHESLFRRTSMRQLIGAAAQLRQPPPSPTRQHMCLHLAPQLALHPRTMKPSPTSTVGTNTRCRCCRPTASNHEACTPAPPLAPSHRRHCHELPGDGSSRPGNGPGTSGRCRVASTTNEEGGGRSRRKSPAIISCSRIGIDRCHPYRRALAGSTWWRQLQPQEGRIWRKGSWSCLQTVRERAPPPNPLLRIRPNALAVVSS